MMNETLTYDKIYLLRLAFKGLEDHELEEVAALTEFPHLSTQLHPMP